MLVPSDGYEQVFGISNTLSGAGVVEFSEFIPWYLGYFGGDDGAPLAIRRICRGHAHRCQHFQHLG